MLSKSNCNSYQTEKNLDLDQLSYTIFLPKLERYLHYKASKIRLPFCLSFFNRIYVNADL
uniref:Uncharacterized protein n=1 Tax=Manihot esculenta TaxID=3983 RepID=A0A2C9UT18_MANES